MAVSNRRRRELELRRVAWAPNHHHRRLGSWQGSRGKGRVGGTGENTNDLINHEREHHIGCSPPRQF